MEKKIAQKRRFEGTVVSTAMAKTVVVRVDRVTNHPKYHKQYAVSKKYKAHCEDDSVKVGQMVTIEACRPISKDKKWRVIKK
jgi:small subunit ribosomal protein S17